MQTKYFSDSSIEAPPSFKPAKKYSDLTGLPVSLIFNSRLNMVFHAGLCTSMHYAHLYFILCKRNSRS